MKTVNKRKRSGFTLIELLVALAIIVSVGGVIVTVVSVALRGSAKTEAVTTVKQNGTFALNQMIKQIRFASDLTCNNTPPTSITITSNSDGEDTTYRCPSNPAGPLSSPPSVISIASNGATLLDNNAVIVSDCSFACTQTNPDTSPQVTIEFTLTSRSSGLFETKSTIPFKSSVILRNIPAER